MSFFRGAMFEEKCQICGRAVDDFRGSTSVMLFSYYRFECGSFSINWQALQQYREIIRRPSYNQEALGKAIREAGEQGGEPLALDTCNIQDYLACLG